MNAMKELFTGDTNDFGFGCMRLPVLDQNDQTAFDYEKIELLFDTFLERGFTYFDTAYTYHSYQAEKAVRKALVERHPRESFELATKLPLRDFKDSEDMERIFTEQLENCGVEYFDCYLLHNMGRNVYEKCCRYDAFGFVKKKKDEGMIRYTGMSFHDTPELLDEILSKYGDYLDFVQLQINYEDWDQPAIQSRKCLETAVKYGKPVTVMEPCKGGTLINLPEEAKEIMKGYDPDSSPASWALRYAASQNGVARVLSGMNSLEQVIDNTSSFRKFKPLKKEEYEIIDRVRQIIDRKTAIQCTGCSYCTHGCPKNIAIPQYFALYNNVYRTTGSFSSQSVYYNNISLTHGKAGDCIGCRQCERACPQHLPITDYLKEVAERFEKSNGFPVRK
jgi:predicted aldo/keto reductase-like oxidoreductase